MTSISDYQAFREALIAAVHGPFFHDWEFPALFGLRRAEVKAIADSFSPATLHTGNVALALNNAMCNLLGYPHEQELAWYDWLSITPEELEMVFTTWQSAGAEA